MNLDPYQLRLAHALYRLWRLRRYRRWAKRQRILYGPLPGPKYPPPQPADRLHAAARAMAWTPIDGNPGQVAEFMNPGWVHRPEKAGFDTPQGFVPYERLLRP